MCKEIINIEDVLLENSMSKVECNELHYYLTTVYKILIFIFVFMHLHIKTYFIVLLLQ